MATGEVDLDVSASPQRVWEVVGSFEGIAAWLPGVESFRMDGGDRVIGVFGLEVRERLVGIDAENRAISYAIVGGVPVEHHRATIKVHPQGTGSRVVWEVEAQPDEMVPVLLDTYRGALAGLASHLG